MTWAWRHWSRDCPEAAKDKGLAKTAKNPKSKSSGKRAKPDESGKRKGTKKTDDSSDSES